MPEDTFKLTLDFPISALNAFETFVKTTVGSLWAEEQMLRQHLASPDVKVDDKKALSDYLENVVIPQQMIASELERALGAANPKIII